MKHYLFAIGVVVASVTAAAVVVNPHTTHAQSEGFSLQVTPSPLVATVKPGQKTELELKIRNSGVTTQELKINARSFAMDNTTGEIKIDETEPPDIGKWVSFSSPNFVVEPGEWYTQKVTVSLPQSTAFSYQFAIVVDQRNTPVTPGARTITGSVAVFTLINVDRPGATRKLELAELEVSKKVYEYLPATIKVKFKNSGNSIVQPYGNIFIQRSTDDKTPIATLPVNETKGYILPGALRSMQTKWETGFPTVTTDIDGKQSTKWEWTKIGDFRIGQYTAKLVGVYNDGERDVPIEAEVTFWVIPWKILLGTLIIVILVIIGLWSFTRKFIHLFTNKKNPKQKT